MTVTDIGTGASLYTTKDLAHGPLLLGRGRWTTVDHEANYLGETTSKLGLEMDWKLATINAVLDRFAIHSAEEWESSFFDLDDGPPLHSRGREVEISDGIIRTDDGWSHEVDPDEVWH